MAQPIRCKICLGGQTIVEKVSDQWRIGCSNVEIVAYLGTANIKVSSKDVDTHHRHAVNPSAARQLAISPEVIDSTFVEDGALPAAACGLSDYQRETRLLHQVLDVSDDLHRAFKESGSIRISRAFTETSLLAFQILKLRQERGDPDDRDFHLTITQVDLEDTLPDLCLDERQ